MQQRDVEIVNKLGLHARPSARLTQLASSFRSRVFMSRNGRRVNAKSIMGVMMLPPPRAAPSPWKPTAKTRRKRWKHWPV